MDRTRKQPVTTLLRAFGFGTNEEIIELFGEDDRLLKTLERDTTHNYEEGLKEIYKKLPSGRAAYGGKRQVAARFAVF